MKVDDKGPTGPEILLAGFPRCGTTFVANALGRSAQVGLTSPKETHFLARRDVSRATNGPGDAETIGLALVSNVDEWNRAVEKARGGLARSVVDASTTTSYYWANCRSEVTRHCPPTTRVIVIVRQPLSRAVSAHAYMTNRGFETLEFSTALAVERSRIEEGYQHLWHYQRESRYEKFLPGMLRDLGDSVLLVNFERLTTDPDRELDRVFRFLDLEYGSSRDHLAVNSSGRPRSELIQRAMNRARRTPWMRESIKKFVPLEVRENLRRLNLAVESKPEGTLALSSLFSETNDFLSDLTRAGHFD